MINQIRDPSRLLEHIDSELEAGDAKRGLQSSGAMRLDVVRGSSSAERGSELGLLVRAGADVLRSGRRPASEEEQAGLEAIVHLYSRPAIAIQNDSFKLAPGIDREWRTLETHRSKIESIIPSAGRINVDGHALYDWIGTGFRIGNDAVLTNRHVAQEFADSDMGWTFIEGIDVSIGMRHEHNQKREKVAYQLVGPVRVHNVYDAALIRLESSTPSASCVHFASSDSNARRGRDVYVVGFPAHDERREISNAMRRIFGDLFGVKRLSPGRSLGCRRRKIRGERVQVLIHDCSTLGGNSGSCVIDVETNEVIGLHYGGKYRRRNVAVPIWALIEDGFLSEHIL